MHRFIWIPLVLSACDTAAVDSADTGTPADTADTADTGDSEDTADTADTGELVTECTTEACGGDPSGAWTIADVCFDGTPNDFGCDGQTVRIADVTIDGSLTLNADGSYTSSFAGGSFDTRIDVPASCLDAEHPDCASVEAELSGNTCVDDGAGGCTCTASSPIEPSEESGTWSTDATDLALDPGNGANSAPFCTDTDELWIDLSASSGLPIQLLLTRD